MSNNPAGLHSAVREMHPYFLRTKFPDIAQKFPVLRNLFPDNLLRELREKSLLAVSCVEPGAQGPRIAKFPVKFPVSREFAWRRVRSALRRQPPILVFGEFSFLDEKGPPSAG